MELRKQKEIEYYDKKAEKLYLSHASAGFNKFYPPYLASLKFLYKIIEEKCQDKIILDYGCGDGIHAISIAKKGARKVIGIDLSEKFLEVAREMVRKEGVENKVELILMDCEKMNFPNNYFDIIFDGGVFSSLNLKLAFPELTRVLKPEGFLIGVETFGHNPLTNFKRRVNRFLGKRTEWATRHIFRIEDFKLAERYFGKIEVYYFHLFSWLVFPFVSFVGGKFLLKFLEFVDEILLKIPILRKYAFKIVFVFSGPRK